MREQDRKRNGKWLRRACLWLCLIILAGLAGGCGSVSGSGEQAAAGLDLDYRDGDGNLLSRDEAKAQLQAAKESAEQAARETDLSAREGEKDIPDQPESPGAAEGGQSQIRFQNTDPGAEPQTEENGQEDDQSQGSQKSQGKTDSKANDKGNQEPAQAGDSENPANKPAQPAQPSRGDQQQDDGNATRKDTVTISIRCDTAVANGMHEDSKWAGIVPANGTILGTTTMEFDEGDTVFDVLCAVRDKYKLHMQYNGTGGAEYIQGINNLYEFDGGRWSGWMYCVNGWYPNYGCGQYACKNGDVIEWNYTCDLGKDLGQDWMADGWDEYGNGD